MKTILKNLLLVSLFSLIPTFLIWLPFVLRLGTFWNIPLPKTGMAAIIANYDGPLYIAVAKTFYNANLIKSLFAFGLPVEYYAAHFPLFPVLIRLLSPFLGYPYAMLSITLASSIFALFFFYKLANFYLDKKDALWLSFLFAILPARFLIVRSIGSPEPLFIGTILASVYFFKKERFWLAGIFGAIAAATKPPGILLFAAYLTILIQNSSFAIKRINWKSYPILLIPLALVSVFGIYAITYHNFFAYFHSGDNIHLMFPPFQIFNSAQTWVGTFWLEEIIFVYLFGFLGIARLISQKRFDLAWVAGIYFASILFVSHRDLLRYALPIVPFIILAFSETLIKKEFKWTIVFLTIPIYLFSLSFISQNIMPIGNWAPLL